MIEILKRAEKERIEGKIEDFGIKIPGKFQFIKQSKDKIRIFTGNLAARDLIRLNKILTIDTIGLYFAFSKENDFRLSFDASILYGKDSKKTIELNSESAKAWLKGQDLENETKKIGYFLIKHNNNILGCGKATKEKILNFVPKERRSNI